MRFTQSFRTISNYCGKRKKTAVFSFIERESHRAIFVFEKVLPDFQTVKENPFYTATFLHILSKGRRTYRRLLLRAANLCCIMLV